MIDQIESSDDLKVITENDMNDDETCIQTNAAETCLISENNSDHNQGNLITIAPCEDEKPVGILSDQYCEELAHPHLFSYWKNMVTLQKET